MDKPDIEALLVSNDKNMSVIALDNYICALCEWGESLGALSEGQKVFYFNQELEREVNNGGFEQYFFNSSGSYAHETVKSLSIIGAVATAKLLQNAIDQFPNSKVPKTTEERYELMQNLWPDFSNPAWAALDERFFAYEDNLSELNLEFVRVYREQF